MHSTPKLLECKGMGALIFLSCVERPKTKREITQDWGLAKDTRQIYQAGVGHDIDQLKQDGFLSIEGDNIYSSFEGLSTLIKNTGSDDNLIINSGLLALKEISAHWQEFYTFINLELTRKELFKTETLLKIYDHETDGAKRNPLLFLGLIPVAYGFFLVAHKRHIIPNQFIDNISPLLVMSGAHGNTGFYLKECVKFFQAHEKESKPLTALGIATSKIFFDTVKK